MNDTWIFIVDIDKKIVEFLPFRWYSMMFVVGFFINLRLLRKWYRLDKNPNASKITFTFLNYAVLGILIGSRLGHVIFYDWNYYQHHLLEIILPFRLNSFEFIGFQGLASHGGVLGLVVVSFLFLRKYASKFRLDYWVFFDRLTILGMITGSLIRLGNFINGEIIGVPTSSGSGFVFLQNFKTYLSQFNAHLIQATQLDNSHIFIEIQGKINLNRILSFSDEHIRNLSVINFSNQYTKISALITPRYPAQLIESLWYLLSFIILYSIYSKLKNTKGLALGLGLILIFGFRFCIEWIKENQVAFEQFNILNQGQKLSIPFILVGICIALYSLKFKRQN